MNALVANATLAYAHELAERDASLATALAELDALQARARALRGQAEELHELLRRLPGERTGAATTLDRAQAELETRRESLVEAERARGSGPEREQAAAQARRALERAEEELEAAARRTVALEERERSVRARATALGGAARVLAAELAAAARVSVRAPEPPQSGLDAILAWTARADGALLLARSGLASEREAVVREANELAAAVLGEQPVPAGVGLIVERLDAALG